MTGPHFSATIYQIGSVGVNEWGGDGIKELAGPFPSVQGFGTYSCGGAQQVMEGAWFQERNLLEGDWHLSQSLRIGVFEHCKVRDQASFLLLYSCLPPPPPCVYKVSLLCFSVPTSAHPSLDFLYHMPNKIWLFQPHSLRPGEGPVESVLVSRERNQLINICSPTLMLWVL